MADCDWWTGGNELADSRWAATSQDTQDRILPRKDEEIASRTPTKDRSVLVKDKVPMTPSARPIKKDHAVEVSKILSQTKGLESSRWASDSPLQPTPKQLKYGQSPSRTPTPGPPPKFPNYNAMQDGYRTDYLAFVPKTNYAPEKNTPALNGRLTKAITGSGSVAFGALPRLDILITKIDDSDVVMGENTPVEAKRYVLSDYQFRISI